jgi:putative dehydrogenase
MVHQLLAGVHICCAAEALALAAKAGVDVEQMYQIVKGAAGNSWMFEDRGKRMVAEGDPKVMSALNIFVKASSMLSIRSKY